MRFIPAAITPLKTIDLLSAINEHMKKRGLKEFEQKIASLLEAKKAYTFTSLMRTNYATLLSLSKIDNRKYVVLPRYSCPSFAHGVLAAGLHIRYCDVNPSTLSYDLEDLYKINPKDTLAIVCANLFGLVNPMDEITDFCRKNSIFLVEGVDYGLGSVYKGKKLGTFGDCAILNFQEGKVIPVGGGAFTTVNDKVIDFMDNQTRKKSFGNIPVMFAYRYISYPQLYYLFIKLTRALNLNRKKFSMEDTIRKTSGEFDFQFDESSGLDSLSNFQGALGCLVLNRLERNMEARNANAAILEKELSGLKNIRIVQKEPGVEKVHYVRYPIMVNSPYRDQVLRSLLNNGIEASPMYIEHGMNISPDEYPGSSTVANELLTLPCHPYTEQRDLDVTIEVIKKAVSRTPEE